MNKEWSELCKTMKEQIKKKRDFKKECIEKQFYALCFL